MQCPFCKNSIRDNAVYCSMCGKKVPRCPTCGTLITIPTKFCVNDGTPIPEDILLQLPHDPAENYQDNGQSPVGRSVRKYCINCGKPCDPGSKYCRDCMRSEQKRPGAICVECGEPCDTGETRCKKCQAREKPWRAIKHADATNGAFTLKKDCAEPDKSQIVTDQDQTKKQQKEGNASDNTDKNAPDHETPKENSTTNHRLNADNETVSAQPDISAQKESIKTSKEKVFFVNTDTDATNGTFIPKIDRTEKNKSQSIPDQKTREKEPVWIWLIYMAVVVIIVLFSIHFLKPTPELTPAPTPVSTSTPTSTLELDDELDNGILLNPITVTIGNVSKVYDGMPLTLSNADVQIVSGSLPAGSTINAAFSTVSRTAAGSTSVNITSISIRDAAGNDITNTYSINRQPGTLTVTKRPLTIETFSASKVYDGTPLTNMTTPTVTGRLEGDQVSLKIIGSQTNIGSSQNTVSDVKITCSANQQDVTANYEIIYKLGTLTVTDATVIATTTPVPTPIVVTAMPIQTPSLTSTPDPIDSIYQDLLNKCAAYDTSVEIPLKNEVIENPVINYVHGSYPNSSSGGMYLRRRLDSTNNYIRVLPPHTPVTILAVRGSLENRTGYAFVETTSMEYGWVNFQAARGPGLVPTNDF